MTRLPIVHKGLALGGRTLETVADHLKDVEGIYLSVVGDIVYQNIGVEGDVVAQFHLHSLLDNRVRRGYGVFPVDLRVDTILVEPSLSQLLVRTLLHIGVVYTVLVH